MTLRPVLLCSLLTLLAGCMDVQTTVRVKSDGSGVVEERMLMSETLTQMIKSMGGASESGMADEEKLRQQADAMGAGVTLREVKPLTDGKREGYVALFSFTDISRLKLDQNPGDKAPAPPGAQKGQAVKSGELITFDFTPGETAQLIVRLPARPGVGGSPGGSAPADPGNKANAPRSKQDEELAKKMMAQMFDGLRIAVSVEALGVIVQTNASHVSGSTVTLLELDFGVLLANAERFAEFAAANPDSVAEATRLMNGLPGIKAELEPEVSIRFRDATTLATWPGGQGRSAHVPRKAVATGL